MPAENTTACWQCWGLYHSMSAKYPAMQSYLTGLKSTLPMLPALKSLVISAWAPLHTRSVTWQQREPTMAQWLPELIPTGKRETDKTARAKVWIYENQRQNWGEQIRISPCTLHKCSRFLYQLLMLKITICICCAVQILYLWGGNTFLWNDYFKFWFISFLLQCSVTLFKN